MKYEKFYFGKVIVKMHPGTCIYVLILYFFHTVLSNDQNNNSIFVATKDWQIVKKGIKSSDRGTPIPRGLHVRHNFETGVTEAKLLDEESSNDDSQQKTNSLTLHPDETLQKYDNEDSSKVSKISNIPINELKSRLKKIKSDETSKEKTKNKFRDYATLKKELEVLKLNITTDSELLKNYFHQFEEYKNSIISNTLTNPQTNEVVEILNDLEQLIHQIDNAQTFVDMDGMAKIITPCLNGTNVAIKVEALRLLGATSQSNPKVQIKALKSGFVEKILHILTSSTRLELKSRCLFALSALIRQFPMAQKIWMEHGGLEIFEKILIDEDITVQLRILKLINDLIMERKDLKYIDNESEHRIKLKQYLVTGFEEALKTHKYCDHLSNLMIKNFDRIIQIHTSINSQLSYNEIIETICDSMIIINPNCRIEFYHNRNSLLPKINAIRDIFNKFDSNDNEHLIPLIENLKSIVSESSHDEL